MLELKTYTRDEISAALECPATKQSINRKLKRCGVVYSWSGRGRNLIYEIIKIPDEFKIFCITKMNVSANADFEGLKYLFYYTFCDDSFVRLPYTEMHKILAENGTSMSRQTISKWIRYLNTIEYIHMDSYDCIYYAIDTTPDDQKIYKEISRELYLKGWEVYWQTDRRNGSYLAYSKMRALIGGHPFKRPKIDQNVFYKKEIDRLVELIENSSVELFSSQPITDE